MILDELKALLGIPLDDLSQDVKLALFLESGLLAAQEHCDKLDFMQLIEPISGKLVLPGPVKLGIAEWVKAAQADSEQGNVVAESIGGMSQSFSTDATQAFRGAYGHWAPYHSAVRFFSV